MNDGVGAGSAAQRERVGELHRKLGGLEFDVRRLEAEARGGKVEVDPARAGELIAAWAERDRERSGRAA